MTISVTLHRVDTGAALDTYTAEGETWQECVGLIVYWLRIEVLPYWEPNTLRLSLCDGTYTEGTIGAIYGVGLAFCMVIDPIGVGPDALEQIRPY